MTTKKTKAVAKPPEKTDKEKAEFIAQATLSPSVNAAAVVSEYAKSFGEQDIADLVEQLHLCMDEVKNGNLQHCEAMLVGQAHALQSIFVNLARRAINQDHLMRYETFLRLALKAQSQCRMTLESLASIKNPPVVFAKQANINHGSGNQQVNNGTPSPGNRSSTHAGAHAGENPIQRNELLEVQHGSKKMDTRTAGNAGGKNPSMATVD